MLSLFRPAPHIDRLPADKVDPFYKRMRWQVFFGIFFGYAGYYLVRKNFSLAMPYLIEQGFSRGDLGLALSGVSIAYGLSKFLMGTCRTAQRPLLPLRRSAAVGRHHVHDGDHALGHLQHRHHVRAVVPERLGTGHGLAALRSHHGALVVTEGARRSGCGLERGPQRGWRHDRPAVHSGDGLVQRLAQRLLCAGCRRRRHRGDRLLRDA